ncbi:MAG: SpoIID/LytB domain-containing protein [Nitriliruptorales bacterium]|nr:SpoIID/LytB domain-containing protein [Nitriliruptorales bacterium]
MRISSLVAAIPVALALLPTPFATLPTSAQEADADVDLGRYAGPLRFEAADGGVLELGDGRRLTGAVEMRLSSAGDLVVVNDVDIEAYVEGIAEMPASWPMEALKAQAVAARTYAWFQATREAFDGYDICDTTACQVFRGREIVETPDIGRRWAQAVAETAGQVLLHENEPILARYFSTSGGHTFNNEDVFPTSGAHPYLVGVPDPDDAISPLHTWRVRFTREQFNTIAARGARLSTVVPVASIERVPQPDPTPDRILVTGENGDVVDITAGELRSFLNVAAPRAYPALYPGPRNNGIARLPSTVPSGRYEIVVDEANITLEGSGWGHGVGLGQWGARGKAERGLDHQQILAAYYNGLQPMLAPGLPRTIRVGLSGIGDAVTVTSTSVFAVTAGDQVIIERGLGTFTISEAADRTLRLEAPEGHGAPLVLSELAANRTRPFTTEIVSLDVVTNKPVELSLRLEDAAGETLEHPIGVVEPGRQQLTWDLDTIDGEAVTPGRWNITVVGVDEDRATAARTVTIDILEVTSASAGSVLAVIEREESDRRAVLLAVALAGTLVGLVIGRLLRPARPQQEPGRE